MSRPTKDQLFLFETEGWVKRRYLDGWTLEQKLGQRTIRMRPNIAHLIGEYRVRPFESVDDETYSDVVKRISTWDTEIEHGTWVERLSHSRFANPALTAELDLSRFDAAPLIAFTATKETDYGTETDGRIPARCGADRTDQRANA